MSVQRVAVPSKEDRDKVGTALAALVRALEAHPLWTPPTPPPGIFFVHDFASRSVYINSEIDNILEGKEVKHPDQFDKETKDPDPVKFAEQAYGDVVSRSAMVNMLIQNPASMMAFGVSQVDFGENVQNKAKELGDAVSAAKSK